MAIQPFVPWFLIGILLSGVAMVLGVAHDSSFYPWLGAGGFAAFVVFASLALNAQFWNGTATTARNTGNPVLLPAEAAQLNARLMATIYQWGAVALFAVYSLTPLEWRHGWQYALGMAVLGLICLIFATLLGHADRKRRHSLLRMATRLTQLQVAATIAGLAFLAYSGKLQSVRGDWPANIVFLSGGIALVLISLTALRTNRITIASQ